MSALDYCKLAGREPSPALNAAAAEFSSRVGRKSEVVGWLDGPFDGGSP